MSAGRCVLIWAPSLSFTQTTLRPDAVVWATAAKALIIELTVPWEEGIQAAHEFKRLKYSDLAAECRDGDGPRPSIP